MNPLTHIRKNVFGHTQADFADALGVSQSTISRWEKGELCPSLEEMRVIRDLATKRDLGWSDLWFFETPEIEERRPDPTPVGDAAE